MSASLDKTYNSGHMDEISVQYKLCADYAGDAIKTLKQVTDSFSDNYRGQSDELLPDMLGKAQEHLELLRECFTQMQNYVASTKENAMELDSKLKGHLSAKGNGVIQA